MIKRFFKQYTDLIIGIIITIIFALTALAPESSPFLSVANITLSPFFLAFIPGYALVSTMYPAKSDVTTPVRYILAILWSLMLAPLLALILYFSPAGLDTHDWKLLVGSLVVYLFFIGIIQRVMTPVEERFKPTIWINPRISIHRRLEANAGRQKLDNVQLWLLISAAILLCSIIYATFAFNRHDPYTEFYVQSAQDQSAQNQPVQNDAESSTVASADQTPAARSDSKTDPVYELWIVNQEKQDVAYTVAQKTGTTEATYVSSFTLAYKEQKQVRITLTEDQNSQDAITFLLFAHDDPVPYRTISFRPQ